MQLLLYWLHACLDLFCIMQKSTKSKINLWHSKNHISNQIRIWIWLIRWKSWFSISVPRKWEVTAARESPGNVTFFLCIQDFQSKKFTWKEGIVLPWCSPGICQAHSSVFAEQHSTPELCTCCTARAQPAGTEHSASETLQCYCLSFHFMAYQSPFYLNFLGLVMGYLKLFQICCPPKWSAFRIRGMFHANCCSKCARTQVAAVLQWPSDQLL